jgi:hypothetical protein
MDEAKDTGPGSVVARADALMQRRRQASGQAPAEAEEVPVLTEVVDPDEDLPVLTEEAEELVMDEPAAPAQPLLDPAVLDLLAQELTHRLRQRLAAELPSLVEAALQSTLAELTRELKEGITETTEAAIRDFLADERERLAKQQQR